MREVFRDWFGARLVLHYFDERTGTAPPRQGASDGVQGNAAPVVFGHFNRRRGFGVEDRFPEAGQFVTVLRDPFEAAISGYFYLRRVGADWKRPPAALGQSPAEYLEATPPNMLVHFPRLVTCDNYRDRLEQDFLEVGIAERLPLSLARIGLTLGRRFDPAMLRVVNDTPRDRAIDPRLRVAYEKNHPLEFAVYRHARERFESRA